jgi:mRNA-degrading endonuclease YafQ of YafQ-DinJ toxin-antitoxin module
VVSAVTLGPLFSTLIDFWFGVWFSAPGGDLLMIWKFKKQEKTLSFDSFGQVFNVRQGR